MGSLILVNNAQPRLSRELKSGINVSLRKKMDPGNPNFSRLQILACS
jgi:hypothetical protein